MTLYVVFVLGNPRTSRSALEPNNSPSRWRFWTVGGGAGEQVCGRVCCWCHRTDLKFSAARSLLVGQSTLPDAPALLASKGLLGWCLSLHSAFLGWQVPPPSVVFGAPSSGRVRTVAHYLDGQPGTHTLDWVLSHWGSSGRRLELELELVPIRGRVVRAPAGCGGPSWCRVEPAYVIR